MGKQKIDQKRFDAVKIMLESGATGPEIVKYMGISTWSVDKIKKAETFQEYKDILAAIALNQKKKNEKAVTEKSENVENDNAAHLAQQTQIVEHRQNVTVQTTYYVSQKLDKICELLTAVSSKLAFVVDELTK